jgi:hypothetical protein
MKALIFVLVICLVTVVTVRANETSRGGAKNQSSLTSDVCRDCLHIRTVTQT